LGRFISDLIGCMMCTSTWVGFFLSIAFYSPSHELFKVHEVASWFFDGMLASGFVGSVTPSMAVDLSGVTASGNVGTVGQSVSIELSGNNASGFVGGILPGKAAALTGLNATGNVGTAGFSISKALTGNSARGLQGQLGYFYWQSIDDSQTANWQNINDSQTANWQVIDTVA
jgi:hypothetical protein